MKIVHVPFCYFPDPVGGTEIYVQALAKEQQHAGDDAVIAAPGNRNQSYSHSRIRVRRYESEAGDDLTALYGPGDLAGAEAFSRILDDEAPVDLVHMHALTSGASLQCIRQARNRGIPVVFSYHTPAVSCGRGTLLRWGSDPCDGLLDFRSCAGCALHEHGLNRPVSQALGYVPTCVGRAISASKLKGRVWTAMSMSELVRLRHETIREVLNEVGRVVAMCSWVQNLLIRNGVAPSKVTLSRQGLCNPSVAQNGNERSLRTLELPVRLGYVGRLHHSKGLDLLIEALLSLRNAPVVLDVFGIVQGQTEGDYLRYVTNLAKGDNRIRFQPAVEPAAVVDLLRKYAALAVPSRWMETGPMVVLEAFAAGIPVIGSNLGGTAELVANEVSGLLVDPTIAGWRGVLCRICEDINLLNTLRAGIRPPRTMADAAADMRDIYCSITDRRTSMQPLAIV